MTRRRELIQHQRKLNEIREILNSMKTLAYIETHKLAKFIDLQYNLVTNLETIARDFLAGHPQLFPSVTPDIDIILLIGSERGFCGDFNQKLLEHLHTNRDYHTNRDTRVIAVGQKLAGLVEELPYEVSLLPGANVVEEIKQVVTSLVMSLAQHQQPLLSLYALYNSDKHAAVVAEKLLPPFQDLVINDQPQAYPAMLNLSQQVFLLELTDHYLLSALHRILYDALMAENRNRIQHLGNAIQHLDDKTVELTRKGNALRQEEIVEEIEVILLNSAEMRITPLKSD